MKYVGSKNRHAKELLKYILYKREPDQCVVDLFAGGMNLIDKVEGPRIANDSHGLLINMWRSLVLDWEPPDFVSEWLYNDIKTFPQNYSDAMVAFVGFCCSYSGKWWGGYARGNDNKGNPRNYCAESKRNILKQVPKMKGVIFSDEHYVNVKIPKSSIVICDPPYHNTTSYKDKIKHDEFWDYIRYLSVYHSVYICEYNAPSDFKCLWEKKVNNSLTQNTGSKQGIERLFKYAS